MCARSRHDTVEPSYHKNANCIRSLLLSCPFLALIRLEQSYARLQRHHTNAVCDNSSVEITNRCCCVKCSKSASVMVQCFSILAECLTHNRQSQCIVSGRWKFSPTGVGRRLGLQDDCSMGSPGQNLDIRFSMRSVYATRGHVNSSTVHTAVRFGSNNKL